MDEHKHLDSTLHIPYMFLKKTIIKFSLISFMQQQTTTLTIVIPGDYRD